MKEKPDLVIDVVDATNLERNLYLTIQLLEIDLPLVIALNMWDEAQEKGIRIDVNKLEKLLCCKVIPTTAIKGEGVSEILDAVIQIYKNKERFHCSLHLEDQLEDELRKLKECIKIYSPFYLIYTLRDFTPLTC